MLEINQTKNWSSQTLQNYFDYFILFQLPMLRLSCISNYDSYMAEPLTKNKTNHTVQNPLNYLSCISLHYSYLDEKNKTKWNQTNCPLPHGLFNFCELTLHVKIQLPMLCLSCISVVEDEKKIGRRTRLGLKCQTPVKVKPLPLPG